MLALGLLPRLTRGVQPGRHGAGLGVLPLQRLGLLGELRRGRVARLRGRGGQRLADDAEPPLVLGALLVGAPMGGEGPLLRVPVDVSGDLPCGRGVFGGAADGAGLAVDQARGEFRGDALEALFLQVEPAVAGLRGAFA